MSNEKAVIVIDLQNCFLPGGSLATTNSRNIKEYMKDGQGYKQLSIDTANFINKLNPNHLFISNDWHPEGHISFLSQNNIKKGKKSFPEAAKNGNFEAGINTTRYSNITTNNTSSDNEIGVRKWGDDTTRLHQKLWPDHCVQGTNGSKVEQTFMDKLNDNMKNKYINIYKGDEKRVDSYSAIADAFGKFTPHDCENRRFINILRYSNIKEVYVTGIARDVCVFWTTLDLLNFWVLPEYEKNNKIKVIFMYDLTRPVASGGYGYTDIKEDEITNAVKKLIDAMGFKNSDTVLQDVFKIQHSNPTNPKIPTIGNFTNYIKSIKTGGKRRTKRNKLCKKRHCHTRRCNKNK